MVSCIKRVVIDIFGKSRGCAIPCKGMQWWNEEWEILLRSSVTFIEIWRRIVRERDLRGISLAKKDAKKYVGNVKTKL